MSKITVREVSGKKGTNEFVDVLWKIMNSKEHPQWVPPLRMSVYENLDTVKNPFYKRASIAMFIAEKDGKIAGRIAAIENKGHNEFYNDKTGFYGFFECIDDQEVANLLFKTAEDWVKARGLTSMQGPMNPSTNHECGLLVRGQSQHPTIMTTWNPKYYETLHDNYGLTKAKDLVAYIVAREKNVQLPEKVQNYVKKLRAENSRIKFRDFNTKDFPGEVERCFDIYNSAWEKNWGFFPMTKEEFVFSAKDMKMILDPRMAFIAEIDGKPAGFMLAVPDYNYIFKRIPNGKLFPTGIFKLLLGKKLLKSVRIITLGVKPEYRGGGIFALFTFEAFERAHKFGYIAGEASWILEDNEAMNKPWRDLGAPLYRRWRIYEKQLS
jgi:GNAT superfamily N-acetyltransferase/predicted metal-dependent hydrolase